MTLTRTAGVGAFGTSTVITTIDSATQITVTGQSSHTAGGITFNVGGATDTTAEGGGVTLKGTTDKTFTYVGANTAWTSNQNFNIVSSKTYKINGTDVLSSTALGSGVTSSSLTSFGTTPGMTSPAITTSLTTPSTSFDLLNTTATTVNFAGAATTVGIGASTGTTTVNNDLNLAAGKVYKVGTSTVLSKSALTLNGSSSGTVTFTAAAAAGTASYTLPSAYPGTTGFALVSDTSGNMSWAAAGAVITDDTTTTTLYPAMSSSSSGNFTAAKVTSSKLTFNASTGNLSATQLTGTLQTASQTNITSVGTLTGLSVTNNQSAATNIDVFNSTSSGSGGIRIGYDTTYHLRIFRNGSAADFYYNATQTGANHYFQTAGSTTFTIGSGGNIVAAGSVTVGTGLIETATISGTAPTSTQAYASTAPIVYHTANNTNNWIANFTGPSGLTTGQSITFAVMSTNSTTAYYITAVQVEGTTSGVTTRWASGAPSSGNPNSIDVYNFTVIKTGSSTYTVLASQSQFV
jgi:hypothetical protein